MNLTDNSTRRDFFKLGTTTAVALGVTQLSLPKIAWAMGARIEPEIKKGEIPDYFFNQLRAFNQVVGSLRILGNDEICVQCGGLKKAQAEMIKTIDHEFRKEVEASALLPDKKSRILSKLDKWVSILKEIKIAKECGSMKTAGLCTIGAGVCFSNAQLVLLGKVEPKTLTE